MLEAFAVGNTLPEAYHAALIKLCDQGKKTDCLDWNTTQIEIGMTMHVVNPLEEPMISKCFIGGHRELEQYRLEMLDGILDFEVGLGNWAYTYHERYENQYNFVINELKRNPSSRRAVMMIRSVDDIGSNDPACWQHAQYFIRNNKLDCMVMFRSNDACKATFMNAFALIMLQKRIADELEIEVGTYTHRANSFHCYEKDYETLITYVERIRANNKKNLCFDYVGDWKDEMDDCREEILSDVQKMKDRYKISDENDKSSKKLIDKNLKNSTIKVLERFQKDCKDWHSLEDLFVAMLCDYASFGDTTPFPTFEKAENYAKEVLNENSIG